jgi:hypothetical protein
MTKDEKFHPLLQGLSADFHPFTGKFEKWAT